MKDLNYDDCLDFTEELAKNVKIIAELSLKSNDPKAFACACSYFVCAFFREFNGDEELMIKSMKSTWKNIEAMSNR